MTNPRTLLLSIAATACGFILSLASVAGPAPIAPAPETGTELAPGFVSAVARDASRFAPVTFTVAIESAASRLDVADRNDGSAPPGVERAGLPLEGRNPPIVSSKGL